MARPTREPRAPRKTRAQRQAEIAAAEANAEREMADTAIKWATSFGAPIMILDGWNPDVGTWSSQSPVGRFLTYVANGNYLSVAAKLAGVTQIPQLAGRGAEYASEFSEDRLLVDMEYRVFVDLHRAVAVAESLVETDLVRRIVQDAKNDPDLALKFLSRRFPTRWRDQQGVVITEEHDELDGAVAAAVQDPNTAMMLAKIAESIEAGRSDDSI